MRAPLLELPLPTLPPGLAQAVAQGSRSGLDQQIAQTRKEGWGAQAALEAAHAALQLGLLEQADALVVEAD